MTERWKALEAAERLLAVSRADQTEVVILERDQSLTRFAASEIHQSAREHDLELRIRVVQHGRVGKASVHDLSEASLREALSAAIAWSRVAPPPIDSFELPTATDLPAVPGAFSAATAGASPAERAEAVREIAAQARAAGLDAYGAFETGWTHLGVVNSRGVRASHRMTRADLNMVVMGEDSSGWASHIDADVHALDPAALARTAIDKALLGRNPQPLDPGAMTVILEPDAMADLLEQVMMAGFGGQAYAEGVSYLNGRLGEAIAHPMVHVWDDPLDPAMLALPFDAEGSPKSRLELIEAGIARAIAHDRQTARRTCMPSTGHVSFGEEDDAPYPTRLRMGAGNRSVDSLVREVSRGIYVTRFHYTNLADPHTASITGMTRDGTFLIENGEITRPLKNLRFTSSGLEALARVVALGDTTKLTLGYGGATRAPAALIEGFRFTGTTTF